MSERLVWERIAEMLQLSAQDGPRFPPTVLYNENWMLRLTLDLLVSRSKGDPPIPVLPGVGWYSEALLPSAFLPRFRGDPVGESYTHADGVIGHFRIGGQGKGDLVLSPGAQQLTVIEGKMFSRLSPGVTRARYFDQAARNVACIAEVLRLAGCAPTSISELGFVVVAPKEQIRLGIFGELVSTASVESKVRQRVAAYEGDRDEWLEEWFVPTLANMSIDLLAWEHLIDNIAALDEEAGAGLSEFYNRCLQFNASAPNPPQAEPSDE